MGAAEDGGMALLGENELPGVGLTGTVFWSGEAGVGFWFSIMLVLI
jgi:hypothetical protein